MDEEVEKQEKGNGGNQKATAKQLRTQARSEVQKQKGESFKAWSKNKETEIEALMLRINLLQSEWDAAEADYDRGIWIAPAKDQKSEK